VVAQTDSTKKNLASEAAGCDLELRSRVQSGSTAVVFLCERMRSLGWRWMNGATPPAGRGEVTTVAVAGRAFYVKPDLNMSHVASFQWNGAGRFCLSV